MRGVSFSLVGPGVSALYSWNPPIPKKGIMAMENTMMPIPPNQWVKLLQKRTLLGRISTSLRMLAPVVVKPEVDSNIASVNDVIEPVNKKGIAPMRIIAIQLKLTIANPSRA